MPFFLYCVYTTRLVFYFYQITVALITNEEIRHSFAHRMEREDGATECFETSHNFLVVLINSRSLSHFGAFGCEVTGPFAPSDSEAITSSMRFSVIFL